MKLHMREGRVYATRWGGWKVRSVRDVTKLDAMRSMDDERVW